MLNIARPLETTLDFPKQFWTFRNYSGPSETIPGLQKLFSIFITHSGPSDTGLSETILDQKPSLNKPSHPSHSETVPNHQPIFLIIQDVLRISVSLLKTIEDHLRPPPLRPSWTIYDYLPRVSLSVMTRRWSHDTFNDHMTNIIEHVITPTGPRDNTISVSTWPEIDGRHDSYWRPGTGSDVIALWTLRHSDRKQE